MEFSDKVRRNLEREVDADDFGTFFSEVLQKESAAAGFESPAALRAVLRQRRGGARRDAAVCALLRTYGADVQARRRLGPLVLLTLWPYVAARIRVRTRELGRTAGFSRSDEEDVSQELAMDVLKRVPKFDPARASLKTFIARIVDNRVATLIEAQHAAKRDSRQVDSLNEETDDEDVVRIELWQTLDDEQFARSPGSRPGRHVARRDLHADLTAAIRRMPPHLRDLLAKLQLMTITEVARATGIPRATIHDTLQHVRARLIADGLGAYFEPPPANRRRPR